MSLRPSLCSSLCLAALLAGGPLRPTTASAGPEAPKGLRAELNQVKGCRLLPKETYAHSMHAELLFDRKAGVGVLVPVRSQERLTYQCGSQKAGVFLYEVAADQVESAVVFIGNRLWGGPVPTAEHPDRVYRKDATVIVISSASRTPLDEVFGPAPATTPAPTAGGSSSLSAYLELSEKGKLLLYSLKRYDEALAHYREYKKRVGADPGAPPAVIWDAEMGVGFSAAYGGKMAEARAGFQAAVEPARKLEPRKLAESLFNLACAEAELGQADAAIAALSQCMAAARQAGADAVSHYQRSMRTDSSLRSLQSDPRLQKIVSP